MSGIDHDFDDELGEDDFDSDFNDPYVSETITTTRKKKERRNGTKNFR